MTFIKKTLMVGATMTSVAMWPFLSIALAGEPIDRIVAIVNGEPILASDLAAAREEYRKETVLAGRPAPVLNDRDVLQTLIEDRLTEQEAKKLNIEVSDQEVEQAIADVLHTNRITEEQLRERLAEQGISYTEYHDKIRMQIRRYKLVSRTIRQRGSIDRTRAQAYYTEHKEEFTEEPALHLFQIVFPIRGNLEQAMTAAQQVRELGTRRPYAEVLTAASKRGAEVRDLGTVAVESLRPEYGSMVLTLDAGEWSEPFRVEDEIYLVYVAAKKPARIRPFDEVQSQIEEILQREDAEKQFANWLRELKEKAYIKVLL